MTYDYIELVADDNKPTITQRPPIIKETSEAIQRQLDHYYSCIQVIDGHTVLKAGIFTDPNSRRNPMPPPNNN